MVHDQVAAEWVEGLPTSKGSLSAIPLPVTCPACGNRVPPGLVRHAMVEKKSAAARERLDAWGTALAYHFNKYSPAGIVKGTYLQPVSVAATFYMPRPKSAPSYVMRPTKTPDIDKLARVVLDALTGRVITDDRQVVELNVLEYYAVKGHPPGVEIQVWTV